MRLTDSGPWSPPHHVTLLLGGADRLPLTKSQPLGMDIETEIGLGTGRLTVTDSRYSGVRVRDTVAGVLGAGCRETAHDASAAVR